MARKLAAHMNGDLHRFSSMNASAAAFTSEGSATLRLDAIDVLRGIVMIIMALDHVRDYFSTENPTNLSSTTPELFLTRWITYFCAPVFFLLTGTGARLALRSKSKGELARFLLTRGLWLIFLEAVLMRCLVYQFNFDFQVTMLLVLWALGWSMIVLSFLIKLPTWAIAAIGVLMIVGHNLLDGLSAPASVEAFWTVLHKPGVVLDVGGHVFFVAYSLIPWVGVTAAGYALGQIYGWDSVRRRKFLRRLGLGLIAAFLLLRGLNVYGDPSSWSAHPTFLYTVLSFLNVTKYPASLSFLLMTLGPALLVLSALDSHTPRILIPTRTFGRVPLFYYVVHFLIIHLLATAICYLRYGTGRWLTESPDIAHYPFSAPPGWGLSLPMIYLIWIAVVVTAYPLCRWFAALRQRRSETWLSYL